jgi:phospholipid/cholesterol/gamma-HCH transport system substrate-binding protein
MAKSGIFETAVGAAVVAVAAAFLVYAYGSSGKEIERGAYRIEAVFGRVDGVKAGSEVRIAGVKVGSVARHALDPKTYEARIEMLIAKSVPVPEDSSAKIVSDGLLGGAYVSIEPGASDVMLADGGAITQTQGSVDLLGLAVQAFTANAGKSGAQAGEDEGVVE